MRHFNRCTALALVAISIVTSWDVEAEAQAPPPPYAAPADEPPARGPAPPYGMAPVSTYQAIQPPGFHKHDGFYLRLALGAGYMTSGASASGSELSISGGGLGTGIAIGGAVADNVVIYGEITNDLALEPKAELDGMTGDLSGNAGLVGIGPGVAVYFADNFYASATLTLSQISLSNDDGKEVADTKYGPGLSLSIGKEWWASENWGLGAALRVQGATMKDRDETAAGDAITWKAGGVSLLFSATFN